MESRLTFISKTKIKEFATYRCACGWLGKKRIRDVTSGDTRSCGCPRKELMRSKFRTHGHTAGGCPSSTYQSWTDMKGRCDDPKDKFYHRYGGRGIQYTRRWARFENFLVDMGERPAGLTLERRNVHKDYLPSNCYWATAKQQMRNLDKTLWVKYEGKKRSLAEIVEMTGAHYLRTYHRLKRGWDIHLALFAPVMAGVTKEHRHDL